MSKRRSEHSRLAAGMPPAPAGRMPALRCVARASSVRVRGASLLRVSDSDSQPGFNAKAQSRKAAEGGEVVPALRRRRPAGLPAETHLESVLGWQSLRLGVFAVLAMRVIVRREDFLPLPTTKEWGEDRGEGWLHASTRKAPRLPNPLLLPSSGGEGIRWLHLCVFASLR